jgi:hypothetical protein
MARLLLYSEPVMDSDFLFVRPSLFHGLARTLDLWGGLNFYNSSHTPSEADARAAWADWSVVGQELMRALDRATKEQDEQSSLFDSSVK